MKKFFTLLIVLTGFVSVASAADKTVRILAVDNNSYADYGKTPYIYIYKSDNTSLVGGWDNSPAMTHYKWDGSHNWYYYDLTTDESNLASVKWIFRNSAKNAQTGDMSEGKNLLTNEYYCWINSGNINNVFENSYYLYDIDDKSFTELTASNGVVTGSIDASSISDDYDRYIIVPKYAKDNLGDGDWGLQLAFRPTADTGDFFVNNFINYSSTGNIEYNDNRSWRVFPMGEVVFNLTYNTRTYAYTLSPYFTRTLPVAAEGYATFSSIYDVIPDAGLTAQYASAVNKTTGKITWGNYPATGIKAGEGALLTGKAGETYRFTPASSATALTTNLLKAIPTKQQISGDNNYILSKPSTKVGFFKVNSAGSWCSAGTAYLAVPGTNSRDYFWIDDETTGIEAVNVNPETVKEGAREYYNLNGQRVMNPSKGLYIVNGKKVIIK